MADMSISKQPQHVARQIADRRVTTPTIKRPRHEQSSCAAVNSDALFDAFHSSPDGLRLSPESLRRKQAFMQRTQSGPRSPLSSNPPSLGESQARSPPGSRPPDTSQGATELFTEPAAICDVD